MELTVAVQREGGSYWSEVGELPGCFASGATLTELAEALEEAIGLYLDEPGVTLEDSALEVGQVTVSVRRPGCSS